MARRKAICLFACSFFFTLLMVNMVQVFRSSSRPESAEVSPIDTIIHAEDTERLKAAYDALPWLSHSLLPRLITQQEHDHYIWLLERVDEILREYKITYMLASGTLLGSYVMHDMLPWDDDLDIFIHIDDLPKMKRLFNASGAGHYRQIQLHIADRPTQFTAKLSWMEDPRAGKFLWHWPFVDITFYTEKSQVISFFQHLPRSQFKHSDFFPLSKRPLAGRWFPTPRNLDAFFKYKYSHSFVCKSHTWDHKREKYFKKIYKANCTTIATHYPFLQRTILNGKVTETLILNGTVRYSLIMD